ncbi:MAG: translation initiation factor IF-2 N-terminal domain-containing protein, partial [Candidatus Sulfotelmatobacter sp.]
MSKVRINDLARELEVKSKAILDTLPLVGVTEKKTHSSSLEEHEAEKVRVYLRSSAEGSSPASKSSSRTLRSEEEIKTKIDLSNISRPGDVLKAITQRKEAVAPLAATRPVVPSAIPVPEKPAAAPPAGVSRPTTIAPGVTRPAAAVASPVAPPAPPVVPARPVSPPPPPSAPMA